MGPMSVIGFACIQTDIQQKRRSKTRDVGSDILYETGGNDRTDGKTVLESRIVEEDDKGGVLMTYGQAVNDLLETFATDDVIREGDSCMLCSTQPQWKNSTPL